MNGNRLTIFVISAIWILTLGSILIINLTGVDNTPPAPSTSCAPR